MSKELDTITPISKVRFKAIGGDYTEIPLVQTGGSGESSTINYLQWKLDNTEYNQLDYLFAKYTGTEDIGYILENLDLSNIKSMNYLLYLSNNITKFTFPDTALINNVSFSSAFTGCTSLQEIDFNSITMNTLYPSMFSNCRSLTSLDFSKHNITTIYNSAFYNCSNLKTIYLTGCTAIPALASSDAFTGLPSDFKIIVPDNLASLDWANATNWNSDVPSGGDGPSIGWGNTIVSHVYTESGQKVVEDEDDDLWGDGWI